MKRKDKIASFIINFCKTISNEAPVIVPLRPVCREPLNHCVITVPEHIRANGGKEEYGWCIHIWKRVLIEAEFHCIWINPSGELIDLTHKREKGNHIIFLPDQNMKYDGRQVNNIRKALTPDPLIKNYINMWNEYFRYTNDGDLAYYHGELPAMPQEFYALNKNMLIVEQALIKRYGNQRALTA